LPFPSGVHRRAREGVRPDPLEVHLLGPQAHGAERGLLEARGGPRPHVGRERVASDVPTFGVLGRVPHAHHELPGPALDPRVGAIPIDQVHLRGADGVAAGGLGQREANRGPLHAGDEPDTPEEPGLPERPPRRERNR
jgi:hypothetical protein